MPIQFDLPQILEDRLRNDLGNLSTVGKEAMLVELYRQGRVSHHEFSQALNISRFEAEEVLKCHNVTEDLIRPDEFSRELSSLKSLLTE